MNLLLENLQSFFPHNSTSGALNWTKFQLNQAKIFTYGLNFQFSSTPYKVFKDKWFLLSSLSFWWQKPITCHPTDKADIALHFGWKALVWPHMITKFTSYQWAPVMLSDSKHCSFLLCKAPHKVVWCTFALFFSSVPPSKWSFSKQWLFFLHIGHL